MIAVGLFGFLASCVACGLAREVLAALVETDAHESHGCISDQSMRDRQSDRLRREVESVPVHEQVGAR